MNQTGSYSKRTAVLFNLFYLSVATALYAYVLVRGFKLSFTHDESLTYTILKGNDKWLFSSNNHWLNTGLEYLFSGIFGFSEIILRMPNILAFGVYLFYSYLFLKRFSTGWLSFVVFVSIVLLNPFALDFFSLARGYGLALAFLLASLFHFVSGLRQEKGNHAFGFTIFSLLCVYANYAFLTVVFANYIGFFVCKLAEKLKFTFNTTSDQPGSVLRTKENLQSNTTAYEFKYSLPNTPSAWFRLFSARELIPYGVIALGVIPALFNTLELKKRNELYFGGESGIIKDTINSVLVSSFYGSQFKQHAGLVLGIIIILIIAGILIRKSAEAWFFLIVIFALVLIPKILFSLIGINYAIERSALYWIPVIGVFSLLLSSEVAAGKQAVIKVPIMALLFMLSLGSIQNFISSINFTHTHSYVWDANNRKAIKELAAVADKSKQQRLGANWHFEPGLNYYREIYDYTWLAPIIRNVPEGGYDFYYINKSNLDLLKQDCLRKLKYYQDTDSWLMEKCVADK